MSQQLGTLLLAASDATVLQFRGDLNQHLAQGRHDKGGVQIAESANYAHGQFPDTKQLQKKVSLHHRNEESD